MFVCDLVSELYFVILCFISGRMGDVYVLSYSDYAFCEYDKNSKDEKMIEIVETLVNHLGKSQSYAALLILIETL